MHESQLLVNRRVFITGGEGMLGSAFREALALFYPTCTVIAPSRTELDVTDENAVLHYVDAQPELILHCAGMSLADRCEREPELARRVNVDGTKHVGKLALATGARVFYPQSVFIFDGMDIPVSEETLPAPHIHYGRTKLEAERYLLSTVPRTLVVRMAGFFGGESRDKNFVGQFVRHVESMVRDGVSTYEVGDRLWQPTYTHDLARNTLLLLARDCDGVYHMGALGSATFAEVAEACLAELNLDSLIRILRCPSERVSGHEAARRPWRMITANARLDREGLNRQRPWRQALAEYLARPYFDGIRRSHPSAAIARTTE